MSAQAFINHRKDDETMRLEILTNVCRMMVLRERLDITKYCFQMHAKENFTDINHHLSSMIDDSKFESMIKTKSDKNIYIIDVDTPFEDERQIDEKFNGTKLIVSMIPHKITDIKNSDMINEVLKMYPNQHKIFIVDSIVEKASAALIRERNIEVFLKDDLTVDLMSLYRAPHHCAIDKEVSAPNYARIHENDPLAKYYNAKAGDTLKIIGNTVNNGFERRYRLVIDPKPVFK